MRVKIDVILVDNILSADNLYSGGAFGETLSLPAGKVRKPRTATSASQ